MATTLTTPVSETEITTKQKLDRMTVHLGTNQIGFYIEDYNDAGDMLAENAYSTNIFEVDQDGNPTSTVALPVAVETAARDLFSALVTVAKNQGWMAAGTETSDI